MNKIDLLKELQAKREKYISDTIDNLTGELRTLEKELFNKLYDEFISKLDIRGGKLLNSFDNYKLINQLQGLIDEFNMTFNRPLVEGMGQSMLEAIAVTEEYYSKGIGTSRNILARVREKLSWINERIGLDAKGNIIEGSYLDQLSKTPEIAKELWDYVTKNIATGEGISKFQQGFKNLIQGNKEIEGAYVRYNQQYSFDVFNQVDEAANAQYAESADCRYGMYSGTIIATTRCFCAKRNNKIFSDNDLDSWINDVSLISYYKNHPYNPKIDRGGPNCRHSWMWVDRITAIELGYKEDFNNSIIHKLCENRK